MLNLDDIKLYFIADYHLVKTAGKQFLPTAMKAVEGGVQMVQLRWKNAAFQELLNLALHTKAILPEDIPLIINDDYRIAFFSDSDGVHLGKEDASVREARNFFDRGSRKMLIGASCDNIREIEEAKRAGADYVGFGAVFPTETKKNAVRVREDEIKKAARIDSIPVFAIGGITPDNVVDLIRAGFRRVAVAGAIILSDSPASVASRFRELLG